MPKLLLNPAIILTTALLAGTALAQTKPATTAHASTTAKPKTAPKSAPAKSATTAKGSGVTLTTDRDKLSYAIGFNIARNMKTQGLDLDSALATQGFKDAMAGAKPLMTAEEIQTVLVSGREAMVKKMEAMREMLAQKNKQEGEAFLAANKTKAGVVTLPDGLQYKILTQGTGPKPTASDTVECDYKGTLIDGKEFDSSYKAGHPISFPVGGVIKGWSEALQLMPVGSKWELFIPANLAYGEHGAGNAGEIPPNATLIFEVDLKSIKDAKTTGKQ